MHFKLAVIITLIAGWAIPFTQAEDLAAAAMVAGAQHEVAPERIVAMMWVESRFKAVRGDGGNACGVMQVHPRYTRKPGGGRYTCAELLDPLTGVSVGVEMLARWRTIKGSADALAHYNSGARLTTRGTSYQRYVEWRERGILRLLHEQDHLGHVEGDSDRRGSKSPAVDTGLGG